MTRNVIVNSPSKWALSVAFFDKLPAEGGKSPQRRKLQFTIKGKSCPLGQIVDVVIDALRWEDGSGESWCFEGYLECRIPSAAMSSSKVRGWFKTTDRQGWIDLDVPHPTQIKTHSALPDPGAHVEFTF